MSNDNDLAELYVRNLLQSPAYQFGLQAAERIIGKRMVDAKDAAEWQSLKSTLEAIRALDVSMNDILVSAATKRASDMAVRRAR